MSNVATSLYLLPCASGVCLTGGVNSILELPEIHERRGESSKVANVVEEQFGRLVHFLIKAALANLLRNKLYLS